MKITLSLKKLMMMVTSILAADRTAHNYQKTGDLITLPYTETSAIDQPFANKNRKSTTIYDFQCRCN